MAVEFIETMVDTHPYGVSIKFNNNFMQIDGKLNSGRINIGSAIIKSGKEYGNAKNLGRI